MGFGGIRKASNVFSPDVLSLKSSSFMVLIAAGGVLCCALVVGEEESLELELRLRVGTPEKDRVAPTVTAARYHGTSLDKTSFGVSTWKRYFSASLRGVRLFMAFMGILHRFDTTVNKLRDEPFDGDHCIAVL